MPHEGRREERDNERDHAVRSNYSVVHGGRGVKGREECRLFAREDGDGRIFGRFGRLLVTSREPGTIDGSNSGRAPTRFRLGYRLFPDTNTATVKFRGKQVYGVGTGRTETQRY